MPFDYKKEYKEFYLPPKTPGIVTVPAMNFLAVRGQGDPNQEDGAYQQALGMRYSVGFTITVSRNGEGRGMVVDIAIVLHITCPGCRCRFAVHLSHKAESAWPCAEVLDIDLQFR